VHARKACEVWPHADGARHQRVDVAIGNKLLAKCHGRRPGILSHGDAKRKCVAANSGAGRPDHARFEGGDSVFGAGGNGRVADGDGAAGSLYGGGGGAAASSANGNQTGGAGAAGVVRVIEFK